ncbi:hypothetical protein KUCAC02_021957 [Chaenocephalus aceratus]|nr:hypothetical protein KUCAC02_021957 [Chaenocephalus aceratus]
MSGAGEVICEGWLRKSPPEKKLRRYVDAGLTFTKKELQSSFVFDLRTEERVWYLVSESEEDMNRWVSCICLLCGFNPTQEVPERPSAPGSASIAAMTTPLCNVTCVTSVTRLVPPPYDPASSGDEIFAVTRLLTRGNTLWISSCDPWIFSPSVTPSFSPKLSPIVDLISGSLSDRASMFEFSESFNSYFINKGLVPLGSEDEDVDENYVPMSAAPTEPPVVPRAPPPPRSDSPPLQDTNYRRGVSQSAERTDSQSAAEPRHRTRVKPAPLDLPLQQDWQEVPPPVRSPVTRTFTREPPSAHSSSTPSSDSDEPDENYVAMSTTSSLSSSTGETVGVSSSLVLRRAGGDKQVEYLDLDLNTGRACVARQKRCTAEGGSDQSVSGEERARDGSARVDYVVVDPKRTKALRSTREAWHDGRMSTEKEKC